MQSNLIKLIEAQAVGSNIGGVLAKIVSIISRDVRHPLVRVPGVEEFTNSLESGFGIRFILDGSVKALRFNWKSESAVGNAASISSIDFFNGKRDPETNVSVTSGESFLAVAPKIAAAIGMETVTEAMKGTYTLDTALDDFLARLNQGKTLTRGDFIELYHKENVDAYDTLVSRFANQIDMQGKRMAGKRGTDWAALKKNVLKAIKNPLKISGGGKGEKYADMDEDRVTFSDSLSHLEELTKGIARGSFNALFVAGKGGTGKTQTVETALAAAGLKDGAGYYKVTGSATAAGIYTLLYKHHEDVILFDDADGALDDVDARNLIKAATDTKKIRKLAWMKSGAITAKDGRLVPPAFNFEGRIIFISNLSIDKLDPDKSIRTRAFIIVIDPSNDEMIEYMSTILPKINVEGNLSMADRRKVLTVVKALGKTEDINLRTLVRALNLCASGVSNWKQLVLLYA